MRFQMFISPMISMFFSTTKSEAVETSIDIIRNSVIELTPDVLVSPT
jgi:hypothetical protein